jgi:predicted Fe-Mo cluster-binding NifX family protein
LDAVFRKAGIEVTKENRQKIDQAIHDFVNVKYKNCPAAWKGVKKRLAEDEESFISGLAELWKNSRCRTEGRGKD